MGDFYLEETGISIVDLNDVNDNIFNNSPDVHPTEGKQATSLFHSASKPKLGSVYAEMVRLELAPAFHIQCGNHVVVAGGYPDVLQGQH